MPREDTREITTFEGTQRKLAYTNEFRQILREHPGIIRTALTLTQKAEDEYKPDNLRVGLYELSWDKESSSWHTVKYGDRIYDPPKPHGFFMERGAYIKEGGGRNRS